MYIASLIRRFLNDLNHVKCKVSAATGVYARVVINLIQIMRVFKWECSCRLLRTTARWIKKPSTDKKLSISYHRKNRNITLSDQVPYTPPLYFWESLPVLLCIQQELNYSAPRSREDVLEPNLKQTLIISLQHLRFSEFHQSKPELQCEPIGTIGVVLLPMDKINHKISPILSVLTWFLTLGKI